MPMQTQRDTEYYGRDALLKGGCKAPHNHRQSTGGIWRVIAGLFIMLSSLVGRGVAQNRSAGGAVDTYEWRKWSAPTDKVLRGVAYIGSDVFAVGDEGSALVLRENQWKLIKSKMAGDFYGVETGANSETGWVFGDWGTIMRIEGGEFHDTPTLVGALIRDITDRVDGPAWAVGSNGAILRFENNKWIEETRLITDTLNSISVYQDDGAMKGWIAAGQCDHTGRCSNRMLYMEEGKWVALPDSSGAPLTSIDVEKDVGWGVGGYIGAAIRRNNNDSWIWVESPVHQGLWAVDVVDSKAAWAVGSNGIIIHFDGKDWSVEESGVDVTLRALAMLKNGRGWAVGDDGTLLERIPYSGKLIYLPQVSY